MSVRLEFQGADFNQQRNPHSTGAYDSGVSIEVEGFDLDYGTITVYPRGQEVDLNLRLAESAPYMNENGDECGEIGWLIEPEADLLAAQPELAEHVGKRYGRVLVLDSNFNPNGAVFSPRLNDHDLRARIIDELVKRNVEQIGGEDPASFADEVMVSLGFASGYDENGDYVPGYEEYMQSGRLTQFRSRYPDKLNPEWNENKPRFEVYTSRHDPDDEPDWQYKLQLIDHKYLDDDNFPVDAIAGGDSWLAAFKRAGEMVEQALASDTCIFF